jgi:hypothetical protein
LKWLAEDHKTQRIILIGHGSEDKSAQCGMAKKLFPDLSPAQRVEKQKAARLQMAQRLSSSIPVPVECYFANVIEGVVPVEKIE